MVVVLGLLALPTTAQTPQNIVREGWHIVRPGESLWVIAARYLGSEQEWKTLHALNPDIKNPHRIAPGQRVRVQVGEAYAEDVAQVIKVSRRVEEQLTPHPWSPTAVENLLNPRDGMRTFEDASTELLFADESRLTMSEDSLVFLGRGGQVDRRVRRDEIEIVMGQGDFDGGATAKSREFVVGGSRIKPVTGEVIQTRLRRSNAGNSQVMVYEGEGNVESGGATQQVERGMGTQMKDGVPPAPPERLLPAAAPQSPAAATEWRVGNPPFRWSAVEGAESYVLEVCGDSQCGQLVARVLDIEKPELMTAQLAAGAYHWRVTPVSPSGLDGYPSATTAFTILVAGNDTTAPAITAGFSGTQIERFDTLYLGVGAQLEVAIEDGESGLETQWAVLDGEKTYIAEVRGPWELGRHELEIWARDRAGNESSETLEFIYDDLGPEIHWGLASGGLYHSYTGEQAPVSRPDGVRAGKAPKLDWTVNRRAWQSLGTGTQKVQRSEAPRFFLSGRGAVYGADSVYLPLRGKGVGVLANDRHVGTEWLNFRLEETAADGRRDPRLIVEAIDWLGNRSSVSWPLGRAHRARRARLR